MDIKLEKFETKKKPLLPDLIKLTSFDQKWTNKILFELSDLICCIFGIARLVIKIDTSAKSLDRCAHNVLNGLVIK